MPQNQNRNFDYTIYYRAWHNETAEHAAAQSAAIKEKVKPLLGTNANGPALDVGCGMGFAMLALQELGYQPVHGIDIDQGQIEAAKRRGLAAERVDDSAAFLAEHAQTYGIVLLLDVLEHVPVQHQIDLLRAILQAMRPGGKLIVQVPNANSPLAARWRYNDYTHHSSFTEHSLRFVLLNAGFEDVRLPKPEILRRPSFRLWRRDVRRSLRKWFVRWLWRQFLVVELEGTDDVSLIPVELNLIASATVPSRP